MTAERPHYLALMLRLWQSGGEDAVVWRASLESPHTGERQAFASLDALIAFLQELCALDDAPAGPPNSQVRACAGQPTRRPAHEP